MAKKPNASKNKKDINASETSSESNNSLNKIIIFSVFFILGVLTFLGMIHSGGLIGNFLYTTLALGLFGYVGLLVPFILIYIALSVLFPHKLLPKLLDGTMVMVLLLSVTGLLEVVSPMTLLGGKIGSFIGQSLIVLVSRFGAALLLFVISVIGILVLLRSSFSLLDWLNNVFDKPHDPYADLEDEDTEELPIEPIIATTPAADVFETSLKQAEDIAPKKDIPKEKSDELLIEPISFSGTYVLPPLSLLSKSAGKPSVGDIRARGNVIKQTLANFGIDVEMDEVSVGPTVTRYAMKPAQGVKLSRIVALKQDLALTLAAHPLRIEAPIPGKSLVGIEIPNISKSSVGLATLLEDDEYQASSKRLLVALGKGVTGKAYFSDLAKMPHLLIAGTTGSGKSVTVHNLIMSLLYRNTPDELRFIMVDPKRVELTLYNDIPHLLTPVIKEPKKAILALKWAAKEMERRYDLLEQNRCRDIKSYHENIMYPAHAGKKNVEESQLPEKMPYIVIIIDELADIMQAYPRELESAIVRLAQMSRATGIHLVLSTQRPSVNVITGLIKANIPSRLALQVASQIDSRTILDTPGAESLLGAGDMLFQGGDMSKPERMQAAWLPEEEIKRVVSFIKQKNPSLSDHIVMSETLEDEKGIVGVNFDDDGDNDDPLYEDAKRAVIDAGKASTSYLQRRLKVGYSRAARLIDLLEERGVVGGADGAKPREILDTPSRGISTDTSESLVDEEF